MAAAACAAGFKLKETRLLLTCRVQILPLQVPSNRLAADEEGEVRMLQPMRLSDFITITDRRSRRR